MKKTVLIFATVLTLCIAGLVFAQGTTGNEADFIYVQYEFRSPQVQVYFGSGTQPELIKCKGFATQSCVIDILTQYKAKGYKVLSTSHYDSPNVGQLILLGKE